jgi:hypothetical protein
MVERGEVLAQLVHDRFGNYALQAALRRLFAMQAPDAVAAQAQARTLVCAAAAQSPHQLNIRRAMRGQRTPAASPRATGSPGLMSPTGVSPMMGNLFVSSPRGSTPGGAMPPPYALHAGAAY